MTKRLTGRRWDIAAGRSNLPPETVDAYRRHWHEQGYDVPPLHGRPQPTYFRGLGDVVAWLLKRLGVVRHCSACDKRRQWLNAFCPLPLSWPSSISHRP